MAEKEIELRQPLPPYIPFKTFKGVLRKLHETALPDQIDLSVLRSYAGSVARQIIASLKYLKLIDPTGTTTEQLAKLVDSIDVPEEWKQEFGDFIWDVYRPVIGELNTDTATSKQLEQKFREAGAEGQMLQKCVAFFVAAVTDAGVTLSPHITNRAPRKKAAKGKARAKKAGEEPEDEPRESGSGQLPSGLVKFVFPIPEKGAATILIPGGLMSEDWEMINAMMAAYIQRLRKNQ